MTPLAVLVMAFMALLTTVLAACRVFDHWEMITQDPMKEGSPSNTIMLDVRKRKGLKPEPLPITEYEDKL